MDWKTMLAYVTGSVDDDLAPKPPPDLRQRPAFAVSQFQAALDLRSEDAVLRDEILVPPEEPWRRLPAS